MNTSGWWIAPIPDTANETRSDVLENNVSTFQNKVTLRIRIINPIDDPSWLAFISNHPDATIFHHPAWLSTLARQYRLPCNAFCYIDSDGSLMTGFPFFGTRNFRFEKRWSSLPFSDSCNLLQAPGTRSIDFWGHLITEAKGNGISQIEARFPVEDTRHFIQIQVGYHHTLSLQADRENLFRSFKKTQVQQPIQKALRNNLVAEEHADERAIDIFYSIHLKTRKRLGTPIQPKSFFRTFYNEVLVKGLGFIILVRENNKYIAGGVFAGFAQTLTYKFGAYDPDFLHLRPNNLMLWTAITTAKDKGYFIFDFGRTDLDNEGLRSFKSAWGTVESPLFYSYYPFAPSNWLSVIRKKVIRPLIQVSPPFVCRIVGETMYSYFA